MVEQPQQQQQQIDIKMESITMQLSDRDGYVIAVSIEKSSFYQYSTQYALQ